MRGKAKGVFSIEKAKPGMGEVKGNDDVKKFAEHAMPGEHETVLDDAFRYLEALVAEQKGKLLRASEIAGSEDRQLVSAAVAIQKIAGEMSTALEEVRMDLQMNSIGFSPDHLENRNLLLRLESLEFFRDEFAQKKVQEKFRKAGVERLGELVCVKADGVLRIDLVWIGEIVGHKSVKYLEFYLRKYLPIGKKLNGMELNYLAAAKRK